MSNDQDVHPIITVIVSGVAGYLAASGGCWWLLAFWVLYVYVMSKCQ